MSDIRPTLEKRDTLSLLAGSKKTQTEVDYRLAGRDAKMRCHECAFYTLHGQSESACEKIVGVVKAENVCDLWEQGKYEEESKTGTGNIEVVIKVNG